MDGELINFTKKAKNISNNKLKFYANHIELAIGNDVKLNETKNIEENLKEEELER